MTDDDDHRDPRRDHSQVRGVGPRQHRLGRRPPRGRRGHPAPRGRGDPARPGRARHPALHRQPQRPRRGHGQADGVRHRRVLPLPPDQLGQQVRLRAGRRQGRQHRHRHPRLRRRPALRARRGRLRPPAGALHRRPRRRGHPAAPRDAPPVRHRGLPRTPPPLPRRRTAQRRRGVPRGHLRGVSRLARHELHHQPRRGARPPARRGADGPYEPAQRHGLRTRTRSWTRSAAPRTTTCWSPVSRTSTAPTARSASPSSSAARACGPSSCC